MYDWTDGQARRKPIAEAKRLLAEAGWPNGRNAVSGEPLVINLDTTATGVGAKARIDWLNKQFAKIDAQLVVRSTDYNRFQEKVRKGAVQLFYFGWNADYPDPENFMFLLHGKQGKVKHSGENAANYENPEYDRLFERMKAMENGPAAGTDRPHERDPAPRCALGLGFPSQGLHLAPRLADQSQAEQGRPQHAQVPAHRRRPARAASRRVESSGDLAAADAWCCCSGSLSGRPGAAIGGAKRRQRAEAPSRRRRLMA
jgi:hypothetical protein